MKKTTAISCKLETIVAIATPPGHGGVAIVRLSGPTSLAIGKLMVKLGRERTFTSHKLCYGWFVGAEGEKIDQVLAVYMAGPATYTGEEVFELHLHGSPLLCDLAVRRANELGARLATPGEFTQRAFINGKIDLTQAEAVLDLIHSRYREAARLAVTHLEGRFSKAVGEVRSGFLSWLSLLEAEIDFGDEVEGLSFQDQRLRLEKLRSLINDLLKDAQQGRLGVQGVATVLVGAPNAGKSSLLNAVLNEERALVTEVAGTTRDRIEAECAVGGVPLLLIDTAGLRQQSDDPIELLGMNKTREALKRADLVVLLVDCHQPNFEGIAGEMIEPQLVLLNKCDLPTAVDLQDIKQKYPEARIAYCELLTEVGRSRAVEVLLEAARERIGEGLGECFSLNQRHREGLLRAKAALINVESTLESGLGAEFLALDLRAAAVALGEILGLDVTEEVLNRIFSQFCLGK